MNCCFESTDSCQDNYLGDKNSYILYKLKALAFEFVQLPDSHAACAGSWYEPCRKGIEMAKKRCFLVVWRTIMQHEKHLRTIYKQEDS